MELPQQHNVASAAVGWFASRSWGLASRNLLIAVGFVVIVLGAIADIAQFVENRRAESPPVEQVATLPAASTVDDVEPEVTPIDVAPLQFAAIPDEFLDLFANTYTVASGDILYEIALRHDTTTRVLIDLNRIVDPDRIEVGQVLALPAPGLTR